MLGQSPSFSWKTAPYRICQSFLLVLRCSVVTTRRASLVAQMDCGFPRLAPKPVASAGRAPSLLEHQDRYPKQRRTLPASPSRRCSTSNFPLPTVPCGEGSRSPPLCPDVQDVEICSSVTVVL